jgi:hypothetical protein
MSFEIASMDLLAFLILREKANSFMDSFAPESATWITLAAIPGISIPDIASDYLDQKDRIEYIGKIFEEQLERMREVMEE